MVKHGRDKKRRAGRTGKTTIKHKKNWVRFDPHKKIDPALAKYWDHTKSPQDNLRSIGLAFNPNETRKKGDSAANTTVDLIELFDIPTSDKPTRRTRFPLQKEEEEYIARCMTKHGDDYLKMFRDIQVNDMQHTETQLRKMGARFLLLSSEQRRVPVPENVKPLLPGNKNAESGA